MPDVSPQLASGSATVSYPLLLPVYPWLPADYPLLLPTCLLPSGYLLLAACFAALRPLFLNQAYRFQSKKKPVSDDKPSVTGKNERARFKHVQN
ncbi:hypothetical protein B1H58_19815 [Pantoea alhagi]|uniref:Uncharacterized protein n=1 Tax=Pantoea alhagi TaxID=1891675 RepID=A0A1W6BAJ2_9GAMM|nr:hypothetical protein [Pantoea alhagi]ARJ44071.1 hypothetical protein B1H58_19815 [Pantoea alhagi]